MVIGYSGDTSYNTLKLLEVLQNNLEVNKIFCETEFLFFCLWDTLFVLLSRGEWTIASQVLIYLEAGIS